jgi:hypothetical protein
VPVYELEETTGGIEGADGERLPFKVTVLPEDTITEAVVLDVMEKIAPFKNDDGSDITRVEFTFALPDYSNQRVWGETPTTFSSHPDCKLRGWAQEILGGGELPVGFRLNTDDLKDRKVRVRLGYKKYFSKKNNREEERNFVADVIHSRAAASAATYEEPF